MEITALSINPSVVTLGSLGGTVEVSLGVSVSPSKLFTFQQLDHYSLKSLDGNQASNLAENCPLTPIGENQQGFGSQISDVGSTSVFSIAQTFKIPLTCPTGNYSLAPDLWAPNPIGSEVQLAGDGPASSWLFAASELSSNRLTISKGSNLPTLNSACKNLSQVVLSADGVQMICAKISGHLTWSSIPGALTSTPQSSATKAPNVKNVVGKSCAKPGQVQASATGQVICAIKGRTDVWLALPSPKTSPSLGNSSIAATSKPSSNAETNPSGDTLVQDACSTFPQAVLAIGKHDQPGDPEEFASVSRAQEALMKFMLAKSQNSKYASLYTAANLLFRDAQAGTFGGSGTIDATGTDLQMAIDTVNLACNSDLSIG